MMSSLQAPGPLASGWNAKSKPTAAPALEMASAWRVVAREISR